MSIYLRSSLDIFPQSKTRSACRFLGDAILSPSLSLHSYGYHIELHLILRTASVDILVETQQHITCSKSLLELFPIGAGLDEDLHNDGMLSAPIFTGGELTHLLMCTSPCTITSNNQPQALTLQHHHLVSRFLTVDPMNQPQFGWGNNVIIGLEHVLDITA